MNAELLPSERVLDTFPLSIRGAAQRLWQGTAEPHSSWARAATITIVIVLIVVWSAIVLAFYVTVGFCTFGLGLLLCVRAARTWRKGLYLRQVNGMRHAELMQAIGREDK